MSNSGFDKKSVIDMQIDSIVRQVMQICQGFLRDLPDVQLNNPDARTKLIDYYEKFFSNDYSIVLAVTPLTLTISHVMEQAFFVIENAFPVYNLYEQSKPVGSGVKSLVPTFLASAKWDNHVVRLSIILFLEYVRATFMLHTFKICRNLTDEQANTYTNLISTNVLSPSYRDEDVVFFYIPAKKWGLCIHELSQIYSYPAEQLAYQFIEDSYKQDIPDSTRLLKQSLFSSVMYGIATDINKLDTIINQKSLLSFNKKKEYWSILKNTNPSEPLHITAIEFLSNFYSSVFVSTPKTRYESFILNAYNRADEMASKHGYNGPACGCRARILAFNKNPNLKLTVDDYYYKKIQKNMSSETHITHAIEEFSYLLESEQQLSKSVCDDFCQNLAKNSQLLKNSQQQLIHCFCNMFEHYSAIFSSHLRRTFGEQFAENNYEALFESGFRILFPDQLVETDSEYKSECRNIYKELITSRLFAASSNLGSLTAFNVMSFVDSLMFHSTIISALEFTAQESLPQPMKQATSAVGSSIRKLQKLLPKDYDNSFFTTSSNALSVLGIPEAQFPSLAYALHTLALTDLDNLVPNDVVPHVFNPAPAVSASAIRSLQTMIAREPKMFFHIFDTIISVFKDRLLISMESLYTGITCLSLVVESACVTVEYHNDLGKDRVEFINAVYYIGLCAPQPTVRQQTLKFIEEFNDQYPQYNTLGSFLCCNESVIVNNAIQDLLHAGKFGNYNISTLNNIKFSDMASSSMENAYLFFLSSFSRLLVSMDIIPDSIITTAESILAESENSQISDNFCIAKAAFIHSTDTKQFSDLISRTNQISSTNQPLGFAIFCALNHDVFMQYISTLKYSNNLYNSILFGLRTYAFSTSQESLQENLGLIFDVLAVFFDYFSSKNIKSDHIKPLNELPQEKNIQNMVTSFLEFGGQCFEGVYERTSTAPAGLFARVPALVSKFPYDTDYKSWFAFTLNLIGIPEVTEAAQTCLSSLLSVFPLPEFCYLEFVNSINLITDDHILLLSRFLVRCIETQLPVFIKKAEDEPKYFHAIANMFPSFEENLMELQTAAVENYENRNQEEDVFTKQILYNAGNILATAFYYIIGEGVAGKKSALRVLKAVGLGTATAFCEPEDIAIVFKNITEHTSNMLNHIHGSCVSPAIALSSNLYRRIPFIGEQFVVAMMQLSFKCPECANVVEPWLANVCFNDAEKQKVIVGTSDEYCCVTAFSFTELLLNLPKNINTLRLIRRAIEGKTEDSMDIAHFIIITIMINHILRGDNKTFQTTIAYIFMVSPDTVFRDMLQFLRFSFWHHMDVMIGKFDALFDIDKFIGQAQNADSDANNIIMYEDAITFVLTTIKDLFDQFSTDVEKYKPWLIIFTVVTFNDFQETLVSFRNIIPQCFTGQEESVIELIKNLNEELKSEILNELLVWGLCCGELSYASRALRLYTQCVDKVNAKDIVQKVLRNLYVCATCLYEKSNGLAKPSQSQWFYVIVDDQQNVDWKTTAQYITACLDLLRVCVELSDEIFVEVFWTAAGFSKCGSVEYVSILNSAMSVMIAVLKKKGAAEKIRKQGRPKDFDGVLTMISESKFNKESVPLLFELTAMLETNSLVNVAFGDPDAAKFVFIALHTLANITGSSQSDVDQMMTVGTSKKIGEVDVNVAFRLLGQIAATTTGNIQQMIFDFCAAFMSMVNSKVDETTVSIIANTCANSPPSYAADQLLAIIQQRGGTIKRVIMSGASTIAPKFPKIFFMSKFEFNDVYDENVDCFMHIETYPPLFINDTGFFPCSLQRIIHDSILCAPAQPFTSWSKLLFKAQMKIDVNEVQTNEVSLQQGLFAKVKNLMLKDALYNDDEVNSIDPRHHLPPHGTASHFQNREQEPIEQEVEYVDEERREEHSIDFSLFIPSMQVVSELSQGLFDDPDIPSVF